MSDDRKRRFARFWYDDFCHEFPEVYADRDAFATWWYLLVAAEKAWPAQPEIPRAVRKRDLDVLVSAGLVALGPRFTFALRGHDAERSRRRDVAMAGANASANARANAQANATANATANAEPSREREREEKELPLPRRAGRRNEGTNPRANGTNPRAQGTSPRQERDAQKRGGAESIHSILTAIQTKGKA